MFHKHSLSSIEYVDFLGAIAGLADQPIQTVISRQDSRERPSRLAPATGIVKGVGKGIVGVFTKPIGGAAELVSQTGQGLYVQFLMPHEEDDRTSCFAHVGRWIFLVYSQSYPHDLLRMTSLSPTREWMISYMRGEGTNNVV